VYVYYESYYPDFVEKKQQHVTRVSWCWSCWENDLIKVVI